MQCRVARYQITILIRDFEKGNGVKFTHIDLWLSLNRLILSLTSTTISGLMDTPDAG